VANMTVVHAKAANFRNNIMAPRGRLKFEHKTAHCGKIKTLVKNATVLVICGNSEKYFPVLVICKHH